jgi:hypothetical protein
MRNITFSLVGDVAFDKLVESAAQLGAVGLRAACCFLGNLLGSGGAQLLRT